MARFDDSGRNVPERLCEVTHAAYQRTQAIFISEVERHRCTYSALRNVRQFKV
jgi:hypothetical protein